VKDSEETKTLGNDSEQFIRFNIGNEEYGLEIRKVKEVIRYKEFTRLPKTPAFVKGIINLRGDVIPVIDLREKFGLEQDDYTEMTRVIVVEVEEKSIGMVVDSVSHVIRISENAIEPPPPLIGGLSDKYVKGVSTSEENLIILLNIDLILSEDEKSKLEMMQNETVK
jgi:purine-binding chemotaxis protein CheW